MDNIRSLGTTFSQMAQNLTNPVEFVNYGLQTSKQAVNDSLPRITPVGERPIDFFDSSRWVSVAKGNVKFGDSASKNALKQYVSNITPGGTNIHGGKIDVTI